MKRFAMFALPLSALFFAVSAVAQQPSASPPAVSRQLLSTGAGPSATQPATTAPRLDQPAAGAGAMTPKQKTSYCVGLLAGADMLRHQLTASDMDLDAVLHGVRDAVNGSKPTIGEEEMERVMEGLKQELRGRAEARTKALKALGEKNKQLGDTFMAANKLKDGVKSTQSGLQYRVLKQGKGITPAVGDKATAHYRGTLLDGTEFDSSYKHNRPAEFVVGGLIPGFNEALQLMKVGDKWQIFVPAELAYGESGAPPDIAPHSTLIFEIELLDVQKHDGGAKGGYSQ